ncbi:MAG: hypothetical protein CL610_23885 [Anaerolineaceae bacterium]|nr:hypothetical protein [Anaerolineaceae bacterium]
MLNVQIAGRQNQLALVLLAGLAILLMAPYLLNAQVVMWPRSGLGSDLVTYNWPPFEYARQSWQNDQQIPLWWGTTMGGIPMIGNPGVRLFYPPLLLLAMLPIPVPLAFALINTFHLWLAGAGAYGLARMLLKTGYTAALFAGIAILLMPRISSNMVGDMGYTAGLCWVPLCILCVRLALERHSWRWAVAAGVALAVLYVLNLFVLIYIVFFMGLYVLYQWLNVVFHHGVHQALPRIAKSVGALVLLAVAAAGLSAFHLLPLISYLPYQTREAMTLADANYLALPLPFLVNVIVPTPYQFPEWEAYSGLLPLIFLPLSLRHPNRREVYIWLFVLIFALLFSLGSVTPLYTLMFELVPGFSLLRVPARIWIFASIAIIMLAALSVDALVRPRSQPVSRASWQLLFASSGLLILFTVAGRFLTRRPGEADWLLGLLASGGVLLVIAALRRWHSSGLANRFAIVLLIALTVDLFPLAMAFAAPLPVDRLFTLPPIGVSLNQMTDDALMYRTYSIRREIRDHHAVANHWQTADGLNSFQFAPYSRYMRLASGCVLDGVAAAVPPCASNEIEPDAYLEAVPDMDLLGALNVRYVISPFALPETDQLKLVSASDDARLYENKAVLPRTYAVGRVEPVPDQAVWYRLEQINPAQQVVIERSLDDQQVDNDFFVPAEIQAYRPNDMTLEVDMPDSGMLVIADSWVPGWQAMVDHEPKPVLRVNGTLRGVLLDAGLHQVTLTFAPEPFKVGLILTILSGLGIIMGFWFFRR